MRKIMLSVFALVAIFALSSFSTATGPSSTPNVTANINIPDYNGYEAISTSNGDGCLEIFMAWTDALFNYIDSPSGSPQEALYGFSAAFLYGMLMACISE
ncbi:MAG: hypothetical protein HRU69_06470 [Flammeovirgaceae bacterium]|nr:MAG: hypothetical protein HRU69_06470 [Flammeovirgaceae bacterium]